MTGSAVRAITVALVAGIALANGVRPHPFVPFAVAALAGALAFAPPRRSAAFALAALALGWWWGGLRLDRLDRSALAAHIGTAGRTRVVLTTPARRGRFDARAQGVALAFANVRVHEPVLLRLPLARPPPQGAIVEAIGLLREPKTERDGFDERTWLRRHGIHVVIRLEAMRVVGHRAGFAGAVDRLRRWLARSVARGLHGERAALVLGVVLGDDSAIDEPLRRRFRASGLYHLLAVSGQNIALVAGGTLVVVWLIGLARVVGHVCALATVAAYVLAVGAQPSVIRAGIAGVLTSLAWLSGRLTDRWHLLNVGALALLAWNPATLFDAGFQLSFVAVAAIFVLAPRIRAVLDGYPLPPLLAEAVAVSAACAVATAPVMWMQFHAVSVVAVPANALVAPVMAPLLGLAFAGAAVAPIAPAAATALAWLNGWLAEYVATCARVIGGLPGAQVTSTRSALLLLAGAFLVAAYASDRWRPSSSPST